MVKCGKNDSCEQIMTTLNDKTFEKEFNWRVDIPAPRPSQIMQHESFLAHAFDDVAVGLCAVFCYQEFGMVCTLQYKLRRTGQEHPLLLYFHEVYVQELGTSSSGYIWVNSDSSPAELDVYLSKAINLKDLIKVNNGVNVRFRVKLARECFASLPTTVTLAEFASPWLGDQSLSDATVVCQDKTFHCHKVILAGRSEVFKRMLTSQFKEGLENTVDIVGFAPDVAELMIKYIYTDKVAEESFSWELFEAAKMYEIPRLQELCLERLRKNISVQNCSRMLEAAALHDLEDHFGLAMDFFKKNKVEVSNTEGWKRVLGNNALLGKIIVHQM